MLYVKIMYMHVGTFLYLFTVSCYVVCVYVRECVHIPLFESTRHNTTVR